MNTTHLMKDPFYTPILLRIEMTVHLADQQALTQGISLTDSQARSTVHRARKKAEGSEPKIPVETPKDQILSELYHSLLALPDLLEVAEGDQPEDPAGPLPTRDWILALRAVEDSIRLRSTGDGSRGYLNFLSGFLAEAKEAAKRAQ